MRYQIFILLLCAFSFQSCEKEESNRNSYIAYNLNGATCNGAFRIEPDEASVTLDVTAVLIPAGQNSPEVVLLSFFDYAENREVVFTVPTSNAGGNPVLITYDSEYGFEILHKDEGWILDAGVENTLSGVSVDVKKFKRGISFFGFGTVDELEVYFTGKMSYKNDMNEIEEHTVQGDLYYGG